MWALYRGDKMYDLKLSKDGDIEISNDSIKTISSSELLAQQVKMILSTNQGEWWLNKEEGIPFKEILVKNPDYNLIRDYIQYALRQIDATLEISDYSYELIDRVLHIKLKINGEEAAIDFSI